LQQELAVCGSKGTNEMRLERLDCLFSSIHSVVMGFDQHLVALLQGKIFFDGRARLIIHNIQFDVEIFLF
jgi:hypothetical protein